MSLIKLLKELFDALALLQQQISHSLLYKKLLNELFDALALLQQQISHSLLYKDMGN